MKRREAREVAFKLTYEMVMTGAFNPETADSLTVGADKESREYILAVPYSSNVRMSCSR